MVAQYKCLHIILKWSINMKYHKLIENASKPQGFWGKMMIRTMNKEHSSLTDWALGYLNVERDNTLLDVGCGGGKTLAKLCNMVGNGKVYGVDYSDLCVQKSIKMNEKNVLCGKAKISQASVSNLPFADSTFDIVTAVETYYFWQDKLNDLKEISRVLKSRGKLLLVFEMLKSEDNPNKWTAIESTLDIKAVSEEEIKDILLRAGYENITTHTKSGTSWLCAIAEKA
jgi:SAM-dependent methyltransferase